MGDLVFVVIVVAFFAITVAYVKACDHIIGPDGDLSPSADTERVPGRVTGSAAGESSAVAGTEPTTGAR